ncbi:MAG: DUF2334 domain-containing protein [Candidatus Bathyarchaeia archaeon]
MKFCRSCYATLSDDETVCHACGTRWPESGSSKVTLEKPQNLHVETPSVSEKKTQENLGSTKALESRKASHVSSKEPRTSTKRIFKTKLILASVLIILLLGGGAYVLFRPVIPVTTNSQTTNYRMIVIFRDDDVQPYFGAAALKRLVEILDGSNIPITFGIIPNASGKSPIDVDKDQLAFLQGILPKESMYETALHGYTHMNATFEPTGLGVSEFAGLPLDRQRELLTQGLAILHSAFPSVSIRTFIPPFDSYDNNTLIALREQGFTVISTDDYTEAVLFGHPPPPRNLPPTPQSPDLPTSQPFILNGLLHLPANYETYNWTTSSFIPLEKQEQRFDLFYARPGSTFTLLLHHWLYTYIPGGPFDELQSFIAFIKGHDGIKFMTIGQFTKLFTSGELKKTLTGWQLSSPAEVTPVFTLESSLRVYCSLQLLCTFLEHARVEHIMNRLNLFFS